METPGLVIGAALRAPPPPPQFRHRRLPPPRLGAPHFTPFARRAPLVRCSYSRNGKGSPRGKARREGSSNVRLDVDASNVQETNSADRQRNGDILELFSKAQQNIMHLNKKRLVAMEELKKLQDENKLLRQDIEVLEMEAQGVLSEATLSPSFSELLLRIDTMVISGRISKAEASEIRNKVFNNRYTIQRAFPDIHLKTNTDLLSELRFFMRKPVEYATITLVFSSFTIAIL